MRVSTLRWKGNTLTTLTTLTMNPGEPVTTHAGKPVFEKAFPHTTPHSPLRSGRPQFWRD